MKMSLSWIFEHIVGDWREHDVSELIRAFTRTTAEIEEYYRVQVSLDQLFVAQLRESTDAGVLVYVPGLGQEYTLPSRLDARRKAWYLIKIDRVSSWACVHDIAAGGTQELLPAIFCLPKDRAGNWKKRVVVDDYIIQMSNTAITHRPDLWNARGLAREVAALINKPLVPLQKFLASQPIQDVQLQDVQQKQDKKYPFSLANNIPHACKQFAGLYVSEIAHNASPLSLIFKLCAVDQRPINALVDVTNYVMFDIGQPMHAFDARKLPNIHIEPRMGIAGQELALLDGTSIKLSDQDIIISDGTHPVSLAGIMGGISSAVDDQTSDVFIESAIFDGATIRLSESRHKLRTQASARFEKDLDQTQNISGLQRLVKLFKQEHIARSCVYPILNCPQTIAPVTIQVSHSYIEQKLGLQISSAFIKKALKKIGFSVTGTASYTIDVPSWRRSKDITQACDIVEEVGRFWGYDNIPFALPERAMTVQNNQACLQTRVIKQHCAFGMRMHEVYNYPFFDESWIAQLKYNPTHVIHAKNPLSLNMTRLINSLVPHLLYNVSQNIHHARYVRFFEMNRTWKLLKEEAVERLSLAGIMWDYQAEQTFYDGKSELTTLFDVLGFTPDWQKPNRVEPWYDRTQTAVIMYKNQLIGWAGMLDQSYARVVGHGNAFVFELNAEYLRACQTDDKKFISLVLYPSIYFDISVIASLTLSVQQLEKIIWRVEPRIYNVVLIDSFSKPDWQDQRGLTFRYFMRDAQKTLTKQEGDSIHARVLAALHTTGVQVR